MKRKGIIALLLSAALLPSIPFCAYAAETETIYIEDFEGDTIEDEILNKQYGWSYDASSSDVLEKAAIRVSDSTADDYGGHGSDTNSLMFSNGDSWFKSLWMTLDLAENGTYKLMQSGLDETTAADTMSAYLTSDMTVSFDVKFEMQGTDSGSEHEQYIRLKSADTHGVVEFRLYNTELYLIALNADGTAIEEYYIADINSGSHSSGNNEWHTISVAFDMDASEYRVELDGAAVKINGSEWIPAPSSVDRESAAYAAEIGSIASLEIGHDWSAWYSCIYLDNITITDEIPSRTTEIEEETVYLEDFEGDTIEDEILNKQYGWSYDASSSDVLEKAAIRVSDSTADDYGGHGSDTNSLMFSNGDSWFKSLWMTLDLAENGTYKLMQSGLDETTAADTMSEYLTSDMTVSFDVKFEMQGTDSGSEHEQYIRLKSADTHGVVEFRLYNTELYLIALNADGTAIEEYYIADINSGSHSSGNNEWHTISVAFDMDASEYRVELDDSAVVINGSEWIPAPSSVDRESAAYAAEIGSIASLEIGHDWSAWYSCIYLDNIEITNAIPKRTEDGGDDDDTTAVPATPKPTATPSPEYEIPDNADWYEDFEDADIEEVIVAKENGWDYSGSDSAAKNAISIYVASLGADGNSLRFGSTEYFKSVWLTLDMVTNGTYKAVNSGMSSAAASSFVEEYLSQNRVVSFLAKFEQDGLDESESDHQQYIRLKDSENNTVAELHSYGNTLYVINSSGESFEAMTINRANGNNDWHQFDIYLDYTRAAFMVEIDGEPVKTSAYGRWIESDWDMLSTMEFGETWSAWHQFSHIDNLYIAPYDEIADVFEITSAGIVNEHGSSSLVQGGAYDIDISVSGGTEDESLRTVEWYSSTDGGATWETLTSAYIPASADTIKAYVVCTSTEGDTDEAEIIQAVSETAGIDVVDIYSEYFEGTQIESQIKTQMNGWSVSGTSYQIDIGSGFGGTNNSLRFASTNSGVSSALTLSFIKNGVTYTEGDKYYLSFDCSFGTGSEDDVINPQSEAFVRIKDTSGTAFSAIDFLGDTLRVIYYDKDLGCNQAYEIATGYDDILDNWFTVEIYLDTEQNKYCIFFDGEAIGPDGDKWLTPSDSIVEGIGKPYTVQGIGSMVIGQEESAWWATTLLDNIELSRFYTPDVSTLAVSGISVYNAYKSSLPLVQGARAAAKPVSEASDDIVAADYVWYSSTDGVEWTTMEDNLIPYDAAYIRCDGVFTSKYGETASCSGEAQSVTANTEPAISNLTINGSVTTGETLTLSYDFTSSASTDNSTAVWYSSSDYAGTYTQIGTGSEYMVTSSESNKYIKAEVTPIDAYGAEGTPAEAIIAYSDRIDFETAWANLSIDTAPSGSSITLPSEDFETGVKFTYSSSNTSVLSNSGTVTHQKSTTRVTLTVTAENSEGVTETKTYTITVSGTSTSSSSGGGGGGGSSVSGTSVSSSSSSTIPAVLAGAATAAATAASSSVSEPVNTDFADVSAEAWYYSYVMRLKNAGIVSGDQNGNFNPDANITRAEFVKMIVELLNLSDSDAYYEFADVSEDAWYYTYVMSAVKFGIVSGRGDGNFGPNDLITRQDMAVIAARAMALAESETEIDASDADFSDSGDIAEYAAESVAKLKGLNIINGYDDGSYKPYNNATRAEAAKIICGVIDALEG